MQHEFILLQIFFYSQSKWFQSWTIKTDTVNIGWLSSTYFQTTKPEVDVCDPALYNVSAGLKW